MITNDDELAIERYKQNSFERNVNVFGFVYVIVFQFMFSHHHGIAANNAVAAHSSSQSSSQPACE